MARSEDQMVGVLLAALVHDAVQPMGGAVLMAGHVRSEMRHLNRMLARADRSFRALRWLSQALRYPKDAQADRQPRRLLRALELVRKKSDQLIIDIPSDLCVLAAPCVPEQVLGTLLSNTRRYARGCRVLVQARVSQEAGKQTISLTIEDDGPGISAKARAQLFDPSAVSTGGGLGVGLWLAQQMLRCNGGDLRLDETARGSSFTSSWPFAEITAPDNFPTDLHEFGGAVRKAREEAGLTRVQLSERAGIAPSTIRNIETARHQPTAIIRARLLRALSQP